MPKMHAALVTAAIVVAVLVIVNTTGLAPKLDLRPYFAPAK